MNPRSRSLVSLPVCQSLGNQRNYHSHLSNATYFFKNVGGRRRWPPPLLRRASAAALLPCASRGPPCFLFSVEVAIRASARSPIRSLLLRYTVVAAVSDRRPAMVCRESLLRYTRGRWIGSATCRGIASRKLIVPTSEGVVCEDRALIEMIDFLMPEKTHKGSCRAAALVCHSERSEESRSESSSCVCHSSQCEESRSGSSSSVCHSERSEESRSEPLSSVCHPERSEESRSESSSSVCHSEQSEESRSEFLRPCLSCA